MLKKYLTEYKSNNRLFGSYVLAHDENHANELVLIRGIGEIITGLSGAPDDLFQDYSMLDCDSFIVRLPEILHQVCFICWTIKNIDNNDILGDHGVIHELIHLLHLNDMDVKNKVLWVQKLIKAIYQKSTGFFHSL